MVAPLRLWVESTGLLCIELMNSVEQRPSGYRSMVVVLSSLVRVARPRTVCIAAQDKDPEVVAQGPLLSTVTDLVQVHVALGAKSLCSNYTVVATPSAGSSTGSHLTAVLATEVRAGSKTAVLGGLAGTAVRMRQRGSWSLGPVHAWGSRDSSLVRRVTCIGIRVVEEGVDLSMILQTRLSQKPEASGDFGHSASSGGYPCYTDRSSSQWPWRQL